MRGTAWIAVALLAPSVPAVGTAAPAQTEVVYLTAVDAQGRPAAGYREQSVGDTAVVGADCAVSPTAVSANIYQCPPSAAGADTCWPATSGSLLCLDDPWDKLLHRVAVEGTLPQVQPDANPEPLALQLDDGTRCRRRIGGAWGVRDDDYTPAYHCIGSDYTVLAAPDGSVIDRSGSAWVVKVGETGVSETHFPPPQTRTVQTAWFAGRRG